MSAKPSLNSHICVFLRLMLLTPWGRAPLPNVTVAWLVSYVHVHREGQSKTCWSHFDPFDTRWQRLVLPTVLRSPEPFPFKTELLTW